MIVKIIKFKNLMEKIIKIEKFVGKMPRKFVKFEKSN